MSDYLGIQPQLLATVEECGVELLVFEARRTDAGLQCMVTAKNGHLAAPPRAVVLADPADVTRFVSEIAGLDTAQRQVLLEKIGERLPYLSWIVSQAEQSTARRGTGRRESREDKTGRARGLWIKGSEIAITPPEWLWPRYILRGHLNLLAGDAEVGKSYMTCKMAVHITTGSPWPDGTPCPKGSVLFVPGEDDESTIAARMKLMGADMDRFEVLQGIDIRDADTDDPLLVRLALGKAIHLAELERKIHETGALATILDPAESFLEAGTKTSDGVAVRQITNPLEDIAQRTNSTTLVVVHLNKAALSDAIHRISGAQTWFNAPRAALCAGHDPDSDSGRRLLLPYKMNLAEKPSGWGYRITGEEGLIWDQQATITAKEMLKPRLVGTESGNKKDLAKKLIQAMLGAGSVRQAVIEAALRALEIHDGTMRQAKKDLEVKSYSLGWGPEKEWYWELPTAPPPDDASAPSEDENGPQF